MAKTERSGHTTTDHDFIRRWVEERGGWPARVVGTGDGDDAGLIRIDFPGFSGEGSLEQIEWDEWFEGFEANQLAFLHRDMDHGGGDLDRFNKLVSRGDDDGGRGRAGSTKTRGGSAGKSANARNSASAGKSRSAGESASARKSAPAGASAAKTSGGGSARKAASTTAESGARASGKAANRGRGAGGGADSEMRGLLLHDLGDLLSAERQFLVTTRALAREAQDPEVRARAEAHVTETEGQIQRINEAFAALGERPRAVRCEAALGLKEEHDSYKKEEKPSKQLLSAFGLGSGLRVEHYEIAAYRSAIAVAGALGEKECAQLLNESLREEMAMASFLEKTSRTLLKRMAASGSGQGGSAPARGASSAGKRASSSGKSGSSAGKSGSSARKGGSAGGPRGRGGRGGANG